ncbi:GntR family transcriptional regulator [Phenylobacterium montanum]|uniref:GntR family transcriptional regulator n=1 Tax=Phenylobacterium montanum TaxID=2823693 RepID=A0A975IWS5_9CAUL|nr:GntR family transcriptional regulator [Caulobacter sp. S6]QUD90198.1 GntR family transcriptional regulator [Caulobacter sp. S6]
MMTDALPLEPAPSILTAANDDSLLGDVIGERRDGAEKGACRVARRIEESLIANGWPRGLSCGSEQALAERFGIGRAVIREAVRILEVRGTARMVRGPRGGLRILEIDPRRTADVLVRFALFFGVTEAQLGEAEKALGHVREELEGPEARHGRPAERQHLAVLDFFDGVVSSLQRMIRSVDGRAAFRPLLIPEDGRCSRAQEIAKRMLLECSAEEWTRGHRLGSEEDLCFRYGVDRDVFRQAVRILESAGAAETFCGRGHGLVSQAPRTGSVARLVSCLFASSGVDPQAVMLVFQRLSIEIVSLAAARTSPDRCEEVARALDQLEDALNGRDASKVLPRVFAVEEAIESVAANPILHLFVQSVRGYPSAHLPRDPALLDAMNRQFLVLSRPILEAFRANCVQAAASAQRSRASGLAFLSEAFFSKPTAKTSLIVVSR